MELFFYGQHDCLDHKHVQSLATTLYVVQHGGHTPANTGWTRLAPWNYRSEVFSRCTPQLLSVLKDITHPVESWTLFFLFPPLLSVLVPFVSVETGFFVSTVFTIFLAGDLLLSPDGWDFEVAVAFFVSLHLISLSFPCLLGVFQELAAVGSLIGFVCLWSWRKLLIKHNVN